MTNKPEGFCLSRGGAAEQQRAVARGVEGTQGSPGVWGAHWGGGGWGSPSALLVRWGCVLCCTPGWVSPGCLEPSCMAPLLLGATTATSHFPPGVHPPSCCLHPLVCTHPTCLPPLTVHPPSCCLHPLTVHPPSCYLHPLTVHPLSRCLHPPTVHPPSEPFLQAQLVFAPRSPFATPSCGQEGILQLRVTGAGGRVPGAGSPVGTWALMLPQTRSAEGASGTGQAAGRGGQAKAAAWWSCSSWDPWCFVIIIKQT